MIHSLFIFCFVCLHLSSALTAHIHSPSLCVCRAFTECVSSAYIPFLRQTNIKLRCLAVFPIHLAHDWCCSRDISRFQFSSAFHAQEAFNCNSGVCCERETRADGVYLAEALLITRATDEVLFTKRFILVSWLRQRGWHFAKISPSGQKWGHKSPSWSRWLIKRGHFPSTCI